MESQLRNPDNGNKIGQQGAMNLYTLLAITMIWSLSVWEDCIFETPKHLFSLYPYDTPHYLSHTRSATIPTLLRAHNRQGMRLCIKDPFIERQQVWVIAKQQIEIFERLTQKEALHFVPVARVASVFDVVDGGVALLQLGVLLEALEDAPAPVAVLPVTCDAI